MFKRLSGLILAAVILLTSSLTSFAAEEYETVETDVPTNILFLGDSIASGFGLDGYDSGRENCRSYANILKEKYSSLLPDDCKFEMNNLAIDGQTSSELAADLKNGKYDSELKDSDCIVISIGGNDMLGVLINVLAEMGINADGSTPAEFNPKKLIAGINNMTSQLNENLDIFNNNISQIAEYINSRSDANLIIQTLYNPIEKFNKLELLKNLAGQKIDRLNEMIISHSSDENGDYTVCDIATQFTGKSEELTRINQFDIHPNGEGHELIAQTLDLTVRSRKYSYKKPIETAAKPSENNNNNQSSSDKSSNAAAAALIIIPAIIIFILIKILNSNRSEKNR